MYKPSGYHHVMIDDMLRDRYRIVDKLGFGGYSTIWLAQDCLRQRYVAIKLQISGSLDPRREARILRALSDSNLTQEAIHLASNTLRATQNILDEFYAKGPNGTHFCYTVAPTQGNLRDALFSRLFPIDVSRALAAKLTLAISFVHSRGLVHGDIHLRNVMVNLTSDFDDFSIDQLREKFGEGESVPITRVDGKPLPANVPARAVVPLYLGKKAQEFTLADAQGLVLSDFGEAFAPATERRLGRQCNAPTARRAPGVLFEPDAPLLFPSDIWSLGTAIWEILGMEFIFSEAETDDEIIAQQIDVLCGFQDFPMSWRRRWEQPRKEEVDVDEWIPRQPMGDRETWPPLEEAFERFVQKYRRKREAAGTFGDDETEAILHLMRGMLKFRPEERLTIDEVLRSEWMVKWALPSLR